MKLNAIKTSINIEIGHEIYEMMYDVWVIKLIVFIGGIK